MPTELTVVDPQDSVFYDYFHGADKQLVISSCSHIEGIGRPRVEPSFISSVIDHMIKVPDVESVATMLWLETVLGRKVGPSTGTNMVGVLQLAKQMAAKGKSGSIVTLLCDQGDRYLNSYFDPDWVAENIGDIRPYQTQLITFFAD